MADRMMMAVSTRKKELQLRKITGEKDDDQGQYLMLLWTNRYKHMHEDKMKQTLKEIGKTK
jgi:hypothetical protein